MGTGSINLEDTRPEFEDAQGSSKQAQGTCPDFVVDRAQRVLYEFDRFQKISDLKMPKIYLDSPMGIKVTEIYKYIPLLSDDPRNVPKRMTCSNRRTSIHTVS